MTDASDAVVPAVATAAAVSSPTKVRLRAVVKVGIALVLLFLSLMLAGILAPEEGQYYSWSARAAVALSLLAGMYLLLTGSWRVMVVPGAAVGAFAGVLKAVAVLVLIVEVSVGMAYGAFMTWGLMKVQTASSGSSSSSSGFSFDSADFDDWDD